MIQTKGAKTIPFCMITVTNNAREQPARFHGEYEIGQESA